MRIEFTKEEIEQIILKHANSLVQSDKPFNTVETSYSYIPSTVAVTYEEPKEADQ